MNNFNEESKREIITEIEEDFRNAIKGIIKLPKNSRFAVYIAYRYYFKLLKKLKRISSENIIERLFFSTSDINADFIEISE